MSVLVTGAAGFIGSHLSEKLVELGENVIGVDNLDPFYDPSIKKGNLVELNESKSFQFYEGELSDPSFLEKIFSENNIEEVIHLAAKAGVRPSLENPLDYVKANITASVCLFEAMRGHKTNKLIFASSSSVYGKNKDAPFKESAELDNIISIYAATKKSGEEFVQMYHNLYGLEAINLRFFTVYGPRQRPDLAIHKFLKSIHRGETIKKFGDGSMARDYTFVADTVQGIVGSLQRIRGGISEVETYNLGNSTPTDLNELIAKIEKVVGKKALVEQLHVPPGDVPITNADIGRSMEYLGYNPSTPLDKGLEIFYSWMKKNIL